MSRLNLDELNKADVLELVWKQKTHVMEVEPISYLETKVLKKLSGLSDEDQESKMIDFLDGKLKGDITLKELIDDGLSIKAVNAIATQILNMYDSSQKADKPKDIPAPRPVKLENGSIQ